MLGEVGVKWYILGLLLCISILNAPRASQFCSCSKCEDDACCIPPPPCLGYFVVCRCRKQNWKKTKGEDNIKEKEEVKDKEEVNDNCIELNSIEISGVTNSKRYLSLTMDSGAGESVTNLESAPEYKVVKPATPERNAK